MFTFDGWILSIYPHPADRCVVWFLTAEGERRRLTLDVELELYAYGPGEQLRALWKTLHSSRLPITLSKQNRIDIFDGPIDLLTIHLKEPSRLAEVRRFCLRHFPYLTYYNLDVPFNLYLALEYDVTPMAYCRVTVDEHGRIETMHSLLSRWVIDQPRPPLRILRIAPNTDPDHRRPTHLHVMTPDGQRREFPLDNGRRILIHLNALLKRHDPDCILTSFGDTWFFPLLAELNERHPEFRVNPNRDLTCEPHTRGANSYFSYGQVIYRGQQTHLYGRWHIDRKNAMLFAEYEIEGILEQALVTGMGVQDVARKSPGSGISAMQMETAMRQNILVPFQKQQAEYEKTAAQLITSDRGGMVYQPTVGRHHNVVELDFVSMYPSIMCHFNISPETICQEGDESAFVPELGIPIDQTRPGLVPLTLRPLLDKRKRMKQRLSKMTKHDCRYRPLKARSSALKWLLVVCFGYLGYKNARFGRIEAHEAVTAYGREALLRAKEVAEEAGYRILHMYVDGIWIQRDAHTTLDDVPPLIDAIEKSTGLPIALEGIYDWVAFLPSRIDSRVPVPNRYFGHFEHGELKIRGIDVRRRDTPPFIGQLQKQMMKDLARLGRRPDLEQAQRTLLKRIDAAVARLRAGKVPIPELLVTTRLSRELEAYKAPSATARAARQLALEGKPRSPGQKLRYLHVWGGVHAWDSERPIDVRQIDVAVYLKLLVRAASNIGQIVGLSEDRIDRHVRGGGIQLLLDLKRGRWRRSPRPIKALGQAQTWVAERPQDEASQPLGRFERPVDDGRDGRMADVAREATPETVIHAPYPAVQRRT